MFEIDFAGWKAQNQGRASWELVREAVQNSLDTGSDVEVTLNYPERRIVVRDFNEQGIEDMSDLWTIFQGDKGSDPEKRGRFGRGINESIAGSKYARVKTTAGTVEFFVDEERKEIDEDETLEEGTEVTLQNEEWSAKDMDDCRGFLMRLWVPDGINIDIESIKSTSSISIHRDGSSIDVDYTITARLPTVIMEDGVMEETERRTDVYFSRDTNDKTYIYEMGIPVKEIDVPYNINVQQKLPLTEMRNEIGDEYVESVLTYFLNEHMGDIPKRDIEYWVSNKIESLKSPEHAYLYSDAREEYVSRKYGDNIAYGDGKAAEELKRKGYDVVKESEVNNRTDKRMLESVATDADSEYRRMKSAENSDVEPSAAQQRVIEKIDEKILSRLGKDGIEVVLKEIEKDKGGDPAMARFDKISREIQLNVNQKRWESIGADEIGVILHELAHDKSNEHDSEWWGELESLAGQLVMHSGGV